MEPNADKNTRIINIGAVILAALVIIGGTLWYTGALSFGEPRMPSFERPTTFPVDFTEETKTLFNEDVAALKERIRQNPKDWSAWLDLAIRYRMVNDNDGAVLIWEYLRKSNPEDGVALHNLGGHYFYEEKNYRKADRHMSFALESRSRIRKKKTLSRPNPQKPRPNACKPMYSKTIGSVCYMVR